MPGRKFRTLREQLFWCYASMQMLMVAKKRGLSNSWLCLMFHLMFARFGMNFL